MSRARGPSNTTFSARSMNARLPESCICAVVGETDAPPAVRGLFAVLPKPEVIDHHPLHPPRKGALPETVTPAKMGFRSKSKLLFDLDELIRLPVIE
jgi:hypothetical protein